MTSVKRFKKGTWVNFHPIKFCIQNQEEEIQPEQIDVVNQRSGDPNLEINVVVTTRKLSSVGIMKRWDNSKINVGFQKRIMR